VPIKTKTGSISSDGLAGASSNAKSVPANENEKLDPSGATSIVDESPDDDRDTATDVVVTIGRAVGVSTIVGNGTGVALDVHVVVLAEAEAAVGSRVD
jgi:hypothetical protein